MKILKLKTGKESVSSSDDKQLMKISTTDKQFLWISRIIDKFRRIAIGNSKKHGVQSSNNVNVRVNYGIIFIKNGVLIVKIAVVNVNHDDVNVNNVVVNDVDDDDFVSSDNDSHDSDNDSHDGDDVFYVGDTVFDDNFIDK